MRQRVAAALASMAAGGRSSSERNFCFAGREMQPLARSEIEPRRERARDRRRHARVQRFLHRPQRLLVVAGLDQDHARRIETEASEAMTIRAADATSARGAVTSSTGLPCGHAAEQRRDETEGSGRVASASGRDLVQGPAGQAALRQMRVERGQAEGQGRVPQPPPPAPAGGVAPLRFPRGGGGQWSACDGPGLLT